MNKKLLVTFFMILIFVILLQKQNCFVFLEMFPPSKNNVEKTYYENKYELISICDFLQNNQYADIRIDLFDSVNTMICYKDNNKGGFDKETFGITESKLVKDLETLKNNGFIRILKEYDYISFQVWGSFGGSVSLIFSQSKEPNVSEINAEEKVIKKIKPTNWFYYKEKIE